MRNQNGFTNILFVIGIGATAACVASFIWMDNRLETLAAVLLVSVFSIFYIRLPNQYVYTFDSCATLYITLKYNAFASLLPSIFSLIFLYIRTRQQRNIPFNTFRFFVNLGMYFIMFGSIRYLFVLFGKPSNILLVIILCGLGYSLNLAFRKGLQSSILGKSALHRPQWQDFILPLIQTLVTSIIAFKLYRIESFHTLIEEILMIAFFFYLIALLSKLYYKQTEALEEIKIGIEACFNASNQLFILFNREALIESFNPVTETFLGYPKNSTFHIPLQQIISSDCRDAASQAFHKALEGEAQNLPLSFVCQNGTILHTSMSLVPRVRNKTITGVYLLSNSIPE